MAMMIFFVALCFSMATSFCEASDSSQFLLPKWPDKISTELQAQLKQKVQIAFPKAEWLEKSGRFELSRGGTLKINFVKSKNDLAKQVSTLPSINIWRSDLSLKKERSQHFFANQLQPQVFVLNQLNCPSCIVSFNEDSIYPIVVALSKSIFENIKSPKLNVEGTSPYLLDLENSASPQKTTWAQSPESKDKFYFIVLELN